MPKETAKKFRTTIDMVIDPKLSLIDDSRASEPPQLGVFGVYVNEEDKIVGGIAADYDFANLAGAAMTRIPAPSAQEQAEEQEITDMAFENSAEIFNICTKLFDRTKHANVDLEQVKEKDSEWESYPSGFEHAVDAPRRARAMQFDIEGYGQGHLYIYMK